MKICYLCADRGISLSKFNGASAHFRSLVGALTRLGHEVLVLAASEADADFPAPVRTIPTPEILQSLWAQSVDDGTRQGKAAERERMRVVHALGHVWNNIQVEEVLREVVEEVRPDVLFEIYSPYGVAGGIMAERLGVPHILNVHAPLAWEGAQYRRQALQEAAEMLEKAAYKAAACVITNCKELRDDLVAEGVAPAKINIVPNGVDVALFTPEGPRLREGLEGKIVVGFVGSLKAWHGVDVLAEAFRVLAGDERLHLLVVGDGPMAKLLQALANDMPGRITLTGAVPMAEVAAYVRAMDIAVAPYPVLERFYFSPLKVLEYMAAGRPTVASRIGQIEELIAHGETGLLVPPSDVPALVDAVRQLASDASLRARMGDEAAIAARRSHTWERRAGEIVAIAGAQSAQ